MCLTSLVQVHVRRSVIGREEIISSENGDSSHLVKPFKPLVRKSKLVVVDLAGSERIQKSGVYPTYDTFHSSTFLFVDIKFICSCFSKWGMAFVCIPPSFNNRLLVYTTRDILPSLDTAGWLSIYIPWIVPWLIFLFWRCSLAIKLFGMIEMLMPKHSHWIS